MRLVVSLFGLDLLDVELTTAAAEDEDCSLDGGTLSSTPISMLPGDGRWNPGADYGSGDPEDR